MRLGTTESLDEYAGGYDGAATDPFKWARSCAEEKGTCVAQKRRQRTLPRHRRYTPQRASLDQALFRTLGVRRIAERVAGILMGRVLCPEVQAGVVAFLVSPDADFITGQWILQDGGVSMF